MNSTRPANRPPGRFHQLFFRRWVVVLLVFLGLFIYGADAVHKELSRSVPGWLKKIETETRYWFGAPLEIGHITIKFLPWPSVRLSHITFPSLGDKYKGNILEMDRVDIRIPVRYFLGLIQSRPNQPEIFATDYLIDGLRFHIQVDEDGRSNITRLVHHIRERVREREAAWNAKHPPEEKEGEPATEEKKGPALPLPFNSVDIRRLNFLWEGQELENTRLENARLQFDSLLPGQAWRVRIYEDPPLTIGETFTLPSGFELNSRMFMARDGVIFHYRLKGPAFRGRGAMEILTKGVDYTTLEGFYQLEGKNFGRFMGNLFPDQGFTGDDLRLSFITTGNWSWHWARGFRLDAWARQRGTINFEPLHLARVPVEQNLVYHYGEEENILRFLTKNSTFGDFTADLEVTFDFKEDKWVNFDVDAYTGNISALSGYFTKRPNLPTGSLWVVGKLKARPEAIFRKNSGHLSILARNGTWYQKATRDKEGKIKSPARKWPFREARAWFRISNGNLYTSNGRLETPDLEARFRGSVRLLRNQVDLDAQVRMDSTQTIERVIENTPIFGYVLSDGQEDFFMLPVKISGPLHDLSFNFNVKEKLGFFGGVVKRIVTSPLNIGKLLFPFLGDNDEKKK